MKTQTSSEILNELKGHWRSLLCFKFQFLEDIFFIQNLILTKLCMHDNIVRTQIFIPILSLISYIHHKSMKLPFKTGFFFYKVTLWISWCVLCIRKSSMISILYDFKMVVTYKVVSNKDKINLLCIWHKRRLSIKIKDFRNMFFFHILIAFCMLQ